MRLMHSELSKNQITQNDITRNTELLSSPAKPIQLLSSPIIPVSQVTDIQPSTKVDAGEGELTSKIFALFEKDYDPVKVSIQLRIPAETSRNLWEKYAELKNLRRTMFRDLEIENEDLWENIDDLNTKISNMPISNIKTFHCENCGTRGKVAIQFQCTECKEESWWGWSP